MPETPVPSHEASLSRIPSIVHEYLDPHSATSIERHSKATRNRYQGIVTEAITLADTLQVQSEGDLQANLSQAVIEIKKRVEAGESREKILPLALACLRVACTEVTGKTPHPEQLLAAAIATERKIIEMGTGEGKTIPVSLSAALSTLLESKESKPKSVQVFTSNKHLAKEAFMEYAPVLQALGLKPALFLEKQAYRYAVDPVTKKGQLAKLDLDNRRSIAQAYRQGYVTYGAKEEYFGHYLADRQVPKVYRLQSDLSEATVIVDEIDSIFIDDADSKRISAREDPISPAEKQKQAEEREYYEKLDTVASRLSYFEPFALDAEDFVVLRHGQAHDKHKDNDQAILLTESGRKKAREAIILAQNNGTILPDQAKLRLAQLDQPLVKEDAYTFKDDKVILVGDYYFAGGGLKPPTLTKTGQDRAERMLFESPDMLFSGDYSHVFFDLQFSLTARQLLKRGRDYLVINDKIMLIDPVTGRQMPDTHLQQFEQALQVKERIPLQRQLITTASISVQRYFRQYGKRMGFTATAVDAAEELDKIYNLEVCTIPPRVESQRIDHHSILYESLDAKLNAAVQLVKDTRQHALQRTPEGKTPIYRPILLGGAISVEEAEALKQRLLQVGIEPIMLHAGDPDAEAKKIRLAGMPGSVMIASNMAGRGTDILLNGPEPMADAKGNILPEDAEERVMWRETLQELKAQEGLLVIGLGFDRSRRIAKQFRGRTARHGTIGEQVFLFSLQDDFFRHRTQPQTTQFRKIMDQKGLDSAVEYLQREYEKQDLEARLRLLEFDEIVAEKEAGFEEEKEKIYSDKSYVQRLVSQALSEAIERAISIDNPEERKKQIFQLIPETAILPDDQLTEKSLRQACEKILSGINYARLTPQVYKIISQAWEEYLTAMDNAIAEASYETVPGRNPLDTYRMKSQELFNHHAQKARQLLVQILFQHTS